MTYETPQIILTEEMIETVIKQIENVKDSKKKRQLIADMQALYRLQQRKKLFSYFPDEGPLRRELYVKHMEFFASGAKYKERLFMAANRIGKSVCGAYEVTLHATGRYPDWWTGKRFNKPVKVWAGGDTSSTCRDILQNTLLGEVGDFGTGMIPFADLISTTTKRNVPDAIETIYVKHISGGKSSITLKSYAEGRASWQGTAQDVIWIDEECPHDVYTEALLRTMTTNGIVLTTFTPLMGPTELIESFLRKDESNTTKHVVMGCWDDVPHLSKEQKDQLWNSIPPHERESRAKGIPSMGSGRIYPVSMEEILIDDFDIPKHWPRCFAMDVGWNVTAAIWGAWDRESDTVYLYSEYYGQQAQPAIHASAIKSRGDWIPGCIDPAARQRSQKDGQQLIELYKAEGLSLKPADNAVEAGIYEVWQRLSTGRMKVFKSLKKLQEEIPMYRRDLNGKIVKKNDHLLDSVKYLTATGLKLAKCHVQLRTLPKAKIISSKAWT